MVIELPSILKDPIWRHARRRMYSVEQDASVTEAAKAMRDGGVGSVIVLKDGMPVGIITMRDLSSKIVAEGRNPNGVKAFEIMSSPLITVAKDETVEKALALMDRNNIRRVVVVDEAGKPYGISVELRICGDMLDRQVRKGGEGAKSWLAEYILEVTEHELTHMPGEEGGL